MEAEDICTFPLGSLEGVRSVLLPCKIQASKYSTCMKIILVVIWGGVVIQSSVFNYEQKLHRIYNLSEFNQIYLEISKKNAAKNTAYNKTE